MLNILYTCGPHIATLPTRMGILYLMRHARVYTHAQINFTKKKPNSVSKAFWKKFTFLNLLFSVGIQLAILNPNMQRKPKMDNYYHTQYN